MTQSGQYSCRWTNDDLYVDCCICETANFKYHWHQDQYELNIVLAGTLRYIKGKSVYLLKEGDIILTNPNEGHASYSYEPGTISFVTHFPTKFISYINSKDERLLFFDCCSCGKDKDNNSFRAIRCLCAKLIFTLSENGLYSQFVVRACLEMIISILLTDFYPNISTGKTQIDEQTQRLMEIIIDYIEEHFKERITLEDIGNLTGYNRTYISTLFQKSVGICFHNYLMLVRLQHAVNDLTIKKRTLTDIALTNGFPDLRAFNKRFIEVLNCLPSDYQRRIINIASKRKKKSALDNEDIINKLCEWIKFSTEDECKVVVKESFCHDQR